MAVRGKDLWASLNDPAYLAAVAQAAAAELDRRNAAAVGNDDLVQRPRPPNAAPAAPPAPKPRTVSEHRKERDAEPARDTGVGSLFERPNPADKMELQYVYLFVLSESARLRREVAAASPKRIQDLYLPYIKQYFYRHLSGISEKRKSEGGCPPNMQGSISVQMWVANELLRISMLYNLG